MGVGGKTTFYCSTGQWGAAQSHVSQSVLPCGQQSNTVLGTAVKHCARKKVGMKSGILFHGAVIRNFVVTWCCFAFFVFLFFSYWKTLFRQNPNRTPHCETGRGRAALVKGTAGAMLDLLWSLLLRWRLGSTHRTWGPLCCFKASAHNKPRRLNLSHPFFMLGPV